MIQVISSEHVKERMVLPDLGDMEPAIVSAITAAQVRMEAELGTSISFKENTDVFYLEQGLHGGITPYGKFRLRLRTGFVRKDDPHATYQGQVLQGSGTPVEDCIYDYVRGLVYVPKDYANQTVTVQYSSGFTQTEAEDTDSPVIPAWFKEAVLGYVPCVFNLAQNSDKDSQGASRYRLTVEHALAVVSPYRRNIGFCHRPVFLC